MSEALKEAGFSAGAYHAGMASEKRVAVQEDFMEGCLPIICATIAFGMGIDKADIRYVYLIQGGSGILPLVRLT